MNFRSKTLSPLAAMRGLTIASVIGILALSGCGLAQKENASGKVVAAEEEADRRENKKKAKATPVEVAEVKLGSISSVIELGSTLESESEAIVYSESAGLILEVLVEEGDRVSKGQILALLENDEEKVNATEAESKYKLESARLKRSEDLYSSKLINEQDYEKARFDLSQSKLSWEKAKIRLENTIVRSTIDGVVTERMAKIGNRATNNAKLFEVMNLDDLFAEVNVPGLYLNRIAPGQEAIIESSVLDGMTFDGHVKLVSRVIDPQSGTFRVKVALDGDSAVFPGLFVNVQVILDTRYDVVVLPKDAIVYEGDRKFVFVVRSGIAEKVLLEVGYSSGNSVEVVSGVNREDSVIVVGQSALKDGSSVRILAKDLALETEEGKGSRPSSVESSSDSNS